MNEQWLATGSYGSLEKEAKRRGVATSASVADLHPLFFRLACDLWSEDLTRTIPARTLYSTAFNQFLAPLYDRLASQSFYFPRLKPNEHDTLDVFQTVFHATVDAGLILLENEARRRGSAPLQLQRTYLRTLFQNSIKAFNELMAQPPDVARAPAVPDKHKASTALKE